jgi:sortase A
LYASLGRAHTPNREQLRGERVPQLEPEFRELLDRVTTRDRRTARILRILSLALIVMSMIILAEAGVTLLWQEPLSYVYAKRQQAELDSELRAVEAQYRRVETPPIRKRPPTFAELASRLASSSTAGEPLGRIRIPSLDLETVIVEDASAASLQKGPAHYAGTPLPGQPGTIGIAGHRTTYQAPFHDLDDLERGDRVVVDMPYGVFKYRVEGSKVVSPDDVRVLNRVGHDRLTLTACHPLYGASERIVVFARLTAKRKT